ncbi:MAG: hypothetical protein MI921_12295 [Cytophagales bacterium]|nr:hypothetical protein [Cytophagales bacterium]
MSLINQEKITQLFLLLKKTIVKSNLWLLGLLIINAIVFVCIEFLTTRHAGKLLDFVIIIIAAGAALYLVFSKNRPIKINKKWPKYIFLGGLVVRLFLTVHGFFDRPEPTSDYRRNEILAKQIYYDQDYLEVYDHIEFRSFRPPGAPLIIATSYFFFESGHNAHIMYSIMSFLLLYVTFLIMAKSWNIFSLLYFGFIALCPSIVFLGTFASSQLPFFLVLSLTILILVNFRNSFVQLLFLGILMGLGSLIRLNMILFMPAVFLFIFETMNHQLSTTIKRFGVVLLFWVMTVAPWTIRNYIVQGDFVLISTNGGANMFVANVRQDYTRAGAYQGYPEGISKEFANEIEFTDGLKAKTFNFIKEYPMVYLKGFPYKMKRLLGMGNWSVDYFFGYLKHPPHDIVASFIRKLDFLLSWFIYLIGFVFLFKVKAMKPTAFFILTGYLIYVLLDLALFETGQRYHFPYLLFPCFSVVLHKIQESNADGV